MFGSSIFPAISYMTPSETSLLRTDLSVIKGTLEWNYYGELKSSWPYLLCEYWSLWNSSQTVLMGLYIRVRGSEELIHWHLHSPRFNDEYPWPLGRLHSISSTQMIHRSRRTTAALNYHDHSTCTYISTVHLVPKELSQLP